MTRSVLAAAVLLIGLALAYARVIEASTPLVSCADFDGDGVVTQTDVNSQAASMGARLGDPQYLLLYDLDADGMIMQQDIDLASGQLGASCSPVDTQVIQATLATLRYRDLTVAIADGYARATQPIAGHGIHYLSADRMNDGIFDPARPDGLNYTEDGRLVAVFYVVPMWMPGNELPPEGFDGTEDMWHYHNGLCQWQTSNGPMVAENVSRDDCLARPGGIWFSRFGWMLHLWNYQHNPMGRFAMANPDLGADGHTMDSDDDGCPDMMESALGLDPDAAWDFYSVPVPALVAAPDPLRSVRDAVVTSADAQAVFAYFKRNAQTGTTIYEQDLNANGVKDGWEYDRSILGTSPTAVGPPDGTVSAQDAQKAFSQFEASFDCR